MKLEDCVAAPRDHGARGAPATGASRQPSRGPAAPVGRHLAEQLRTFSSPPSQVGSLPSVRPRHRAVLLPANCLPCVALLQLQGSNIRSLPAGQIYFFEASPAAAGQHRRATRIGELICGVFSTSLDSHPDKKKLDFDFFRCSEIQGKRFFEELDRDGDGEVTLGLIHGSD
ncbi:hypothetical protein ZWY2020_000878 [Hordeum vulgare]|nr:hypothetical protein ZWY2020_000878 [Hordeum vulgare]